MRWHTYFVALIVLATGGSAFGMIIDGTGSVTDWGVTPFSRSNGTNLQLGNLWSTIADDYAPIDYPGIGYEPSPGLASGGEAFDLEEMHLRLADGRIQVLVVTSSPGAATSGRTTYWLGDLFLTINGVDYGVITGSHAQGLTAGDLYRLDGDEDVVILQATAQSYAGSRTLVENDYGDPATIGEIAGPWAVRGIINADQCVGSATLQTATFNYGGAENGTYLIEYSVDLATLGLADVPIGATAHLTWGCGNDLIEVMGSGSPSVVPEPATLGLGAIGVSMTYLLERRRQARQPKQAMSA